MRTFPFVTVLAVISSVGLVGCGGDDETPSTTADTGTAATDTGTPATDSGAPAEDTGTATDTGEATDTGTPPGDSGDDTAMPVVVNGCAAADYVDATTDAAKRKLDPWTVASGKQCITIKKGQSFTWTPGGGFATHPLAAKDGTMPSPITSTTTGATKTFDFPNEGTYGFVCTVHSVMTGAIRVIP